MNTMRVLGLLLLMLFGICSSVSAQRYDNYYLNGAYHKDMEFIIHAGALKSNLRYGNNTAYDVGIDYTPYEADGCFSYSFITNFQKGEDYWTINPVGALAIVSCLFCKNIVERDETIKKILIVMSAESMSLNFAMGRNFEISPYWSLMRLSRWQNRTTYVTGGAGLRVNTYFGPKNRISFRVRGEYSWGYGNPEWYGEMFYNLFSENEEKGFYSDYKKPCTPFRGWHYGISLGYSF